MDTCFRFLNSVLMDTRMKDFFLSLMIFMLQISKLSSRKQDVCVWNTFNATCEANEVIQMEYAYYGRMSVGRCIPEAHKMGCQEDALTYFDSICSGRQSCQIKLPDERLAAAYQPCPRGLESYLQLQFKCNAVHFSTTPCAGVPLQVVKTQGLFANFITGRTGQGSSDCPWEVMGAPGQRIRLTIHDYGVWPSAASQDEGSVGRNHGLRGPEKSDMCRIFAKVKEVGNVNSIPLCGREAEEKITYLSETEGVQIVLTNPQKTQHSSYFLLQFEVVGCPDYIPPEGSVITRHENDITVKCADSGREWHMSCDGTRWNSESNSKDCSGSDGLSVSVGALFESARTIPQWILIVVIIAAAVIIAIPILVIGIVSFRRRLAPVIESVQMDADKSYPLHNAKEHDPMLDKHYRSQHSFQGGDYTNTAQRHMAVRPDIDREAGRFPTLPLPPSRSATSARNNTLHRTPNHRGYSSGSHHVTPKPSDTTHEYELPKVPQRTHSASYAGGPFYHELDPERTNCPTGTPPKASGCDTETLDVASSMPPPPELFSKDEKA